MRKDTIERLDRMEKEELEYLAEAFAGRCFVSEDFATALEMRKPEGECGLYAWEEEIEKEICVEAEEILRPQADPIFAKVQEYLGGSRPEQSKKELLELLADFLEIDEAAEYLLLTMTDDELAELPEMFGLEGTYDRLKQDPVFQSRQAYFRRMQSYYQAAVNLYGVIALEDFLGLVLHYEKEFEENEGAGAVYERAEGPYRKSLMFDPQYLCMAGIEGVIMMCDNSAMITADGLMLHPSFFAEYTGEMDALSDAIENDPEMEEDDFWEEFELNFGEAVYRRLFDEAIEKPFYIPDRETFLRYSEEEYFEETEASQALKQFLEENYGEIIGKTASEEEISEDLLLEEVMTQLRCVISDNCPQRCLTGNGETGRAALKELEQLGVMPNGEKLEELRGYVRAVKKSERTWAGHGYSQKELEDLEA